MLEDFNRSREKGRKKLGQVFDVLFVINMKLNHSKPPWIAPPEVIWPFYLRFGHPIFAPYSVHFLRNSQEQLLFE